MKLYVKNITREPNDTLYSFLYRVLNIDGSGFNYKATVNATFFDPELEKIQCVNRKYRSFDDIVLISKTYFKVSDKAVAKVIIKFLNNNQRLSLVLCDTAKKWVLYSGLIKHENLEYCAKYNKGYTKINNPYNGNYSYNDILTLAGLEKEEQVNE